GQDLVRVSLVSNVPDEAVTGRIEHVMKRDRQLDNAEPGPEMPAGYRHRVDRLSAQLVGDLRQLLLGQAAKVLRRMDFIEKRGRDHVLLAETKGQIVVKSEHKETRPPPRKKPRLNRFPPHSDHAADC